MIFGSVDAIVPQRLLLAAAIAAGCWLAPPALLAKPAPAWAAESASISLAAPDTGVAAESVQTLQERIKAASEAVRAKERKIGELQTRIGILSAHRSESAEILAKRRAETASALFALQGVAGLPPVAILIGARRPLDIVRGGTALDSVVEQLALTVEREQQRSYRLNQARRTAIAERNRLAEAVQALEAEQHDLAARLAAGADRPADPGTPLKEQVAQEDSGQQPAAAPGAAASPPAAANAEAGVEAREEAGEEPGEQAGEERVAALHGDEAAPASPVTGRVVVRFGEESGGAPASKGIQIAARPAAQVVAPSGGRVAFAGPFRGYGLLLILDHGDGYHSLMAGFARIDVTIGKQIVAGERLGVMGDAQTGRPALYVEVRRQGRPINPLPWFAQAHGKASG